LLRRCKVSFCFQNFPANLSRSTHETEAILADLVALTARHLKKGARLRLTGLGILQVRHRAARMGRNPSTGEAIRIKASKKIAFPPRS
jgi:DNA-binding protein HU-beta